jgi:protein-S-isoprenylcysteine O-methyltransferase Ste14
MQTIFVALRSAVFGAGFFWLWTWIALLLRAFDPPLGGPLPPWTASAGAAILSAGAVLALWCIGAFIVRGRGTPALFDPPRRFVAVGPYRLVRNPMYVGGALLLLGFGLSQRSPAIVLFVPLWALLFHLLVVLYEEGALQAKFGSEYDDYCRRTPRWIPRAL